MKFIFMCLFILSTLLVQSLSQTEGSSSTSSKLSSSSTEPKSSSKTPGSSSSKLSSIQTTSSSKPSGSSSSKLSSIQTTSSSDECLKLNATCEECLSNSNCFYCFEDNTCRKYVIDGIFPEGCKASQARWFSCYVNFEALLIGLIVTAVVILLIVGCCLCYCCNKTCKAMSNRSLKRVEKKIIKQRDFIKQKNAERKRDREARNDAIRVKYGLKPSTYSSLDE